jgi:hypothetical protein
VDPTWETRPLPTAVESLRSISEMIVDPSAIAPELGLQLLDPNPQRRLQALEILDLGGVG